MFKVLSMRNNNFLFTFLEFVNNIWIELFEVWYYIVLTISLKVSYIPVYNTMKNQNLKEDTLTSPAFWSISYESWLLYWPMLNFNNNGLLLEQCSNSKAPALGFQVCDKFFLTSDSGGALTIFCAFLYFLFFYWRIVGGKTT